MSNVILWYSNLSKGDQQGFWILVIGGVFLLVGSWVVWMLRTRYSYQYTTPSGKTVTINFSFQGYTIDDGYNFYDTLIMAERDADFLYRNYKPSKGTK